MRITRRERRLALEGRVWWRRLARLVWALALDLAGLAAAYTAVRESDVPGLWLVLSTYLLLAGVTGAHRVDLRLPGFAARARLARALVVAAFVAFSFWSYGWLETATNARQGAQATAPSNRVDDKGRSASSNEVYDGGRTAPPEWKTPEGTQFEDETSRGSTGDGSDSSSPGVAPDFGDAARSDTAGGEEAEPEGRSAVSPDAQSGTNAPVPGPVDLSDLPRAWTDARSRQRVAQVAAPLTVITSDERRFELVGLRPPRPASRSRTLLTRELAGLAERDVEIIPCEAAREVVPALIRLDGEWLNKRLLRLGLASFQAGSACLGVSLDWTAEEDVARQANRGIWYRPRSRTAR